ncbi:MAG TPA: PIG-L family deacetylase [Bryobacteraceae bacterium]|nr:PIG-L family deacetylase [Bryobacteraceae bacterium]
MRNITVVAHPDDEVIGIGGQLPELEDVSILYVTDGAPRDMRDATEYGFATVEEYAAARRREAEAALALAGIGVERLCWLGIADQEASCHMAELSRRLCEALAAPAPAVVWTHPYEGGHPDHDATAFAVQSACALLGVAAPERREFTSYHARAQAIVTYEFLPHPNAPETVTPLSPDALDRKRQMVECFATQRRTLEVFTHCAVEKSRPAPRYDFTAPPHAGMVYYDQFPWGIRSPEWRLLAGAALQELGLR